VKVVEGLRDAKLLRRRAGAVGHVAEGGDAHPETAQGFEVDRPDEAGADEAGLELRSVFADFVLAARCGRAGLTVKLAANGLAGPLHGCGLTADKC